MRPLRLARVAAEAEGLRLRTMAQRMATRAVMGLLALVFLTGTLTFGHVALWYWLRLEHGLTQLWAAAALGGSDLVVAALLAVLAMRSSPGRVEREALEIRQRAWDSATRSLALSAMLMPVVRLGLSTLRRRPEKARRR